MKTSRYNLIIGGVFLMLALLFDLFYQKAFTKTVLEVFDSAYFIFSPFLRFSTFAAAFLLIVSGMIQATGAFSKKATVITIPIVAVMIAVLSVLPFHSIYLIDSTHITKYIFTNKAESLEYGQIKQADLSLEYRPGIMGRTPSGETLRYTLLFDDDSRLSFSVNDCAAEDINLIVAFDEKIAAIRSVSASCGGINQIAASNKYFSEQTTEYFFSLFGQSETNNDFWVLPIFGLIVFIVDLFTLNKYIRPKKNACTSVFDKLFSKSNFKKSDKLLWFGNLMNVLFFIVTVVFFIAGFFTNIEAVFLILLYIGFMLLIFDGICCVVCTIGQRGGSVS